MEIKNIPLETEIRLKELKEPIYGKIMMEPWEILMITKLEYETLNNEIE